MLDLEPLHCNLKYDMVIILADFTIHDWFGYTASFVSLTKFDTLFFSFREEFNWTIDIEFPDYFNCFGYDDHINNVKSINTRPREIFPPSDIVFNIFQSLKIFIVQRFHFLGYIYPEIF